jgi:hypothetical protein
MARIRGIIRTHRDSNKGCYILPVTSRQAEEPLEDRTREGAKACAVMAATGTKQQTPP